MEAARHRSLAAKTAQLQEVQRENWSRTLLHPCLLGLTSGLEQAYSHVEGVKCGTAYTESCYTLTQYMAGLFPDRPVQVLLHNPTLRSAHLTRVWHLHPRSADS